MIIPVTTIIVPAAGAEIFLDWEQSKAWRIDCGALTYKQSFLFEIINLPVRAIGRTLVCLSNVRYAGITGAYKTYPGWVALPLARDGRENGYELRTWDEGYSFSVRRLSRYP